jgi:hypothetical protein
MSDVVEIVTSVLGLTDVKNQWRQASKAGTELAHEKMFTLCKLRVLYSNKVTDETCSYVMSAVQK